MLAFSSLFVVGNYFCADSPSPLNHKLRGEPFNLTQVQWSSLLSIYSMPNMILPLLGGIFIDKLGIR